MLLQNLMGVVEAPDQDVVAKLVTNRKTGESRVEINPDKWNELEEETKKAVMRHEMIHLRHHNHGEKFRREAKRLNAPLSYKGALGEPAKVQVKSEDDYYYDTYKEFDDVWKAEEWIEEHKEDLWAEGYTKYRVKV